MTIWNNNESKPWPMLDEDLNFIRRLPLFCNMMTGNFDDLMRGMTMIGAQAGEIVVEQGAPADHLFVVLEGAVEMYSHWGSRECTMGVLQPVESFILAACIKNAPYLMAARALRPTRLVLLPAADLRSVFRRDPEFAVSVIEELAGDFRRVVRHAKGLKLRGTLQRIAAYLLEQSRLADNADHYQLQVEKRHVASYLGMTPENLSRGLRTLVGEGVSVTGQAVTIHDRARLIAFVNPDILIDGPDAPGSSSGVGLPGPLYSGGGSDRA